MGQAVVAERRLFVDEVLLGDDDGGGALVLHTPVLVEAGQRFWVSESHLVVEDETGHRQRFPGSRETRCYGR